MSENGYHDWREVQATVLELEVEAITAMLGRVAELDGLLAATEGSQVALAARKRGKSYASLLGTLAIDLEQYARSLRDEAREAADG